VAECRRWAENSDRSRPHLQLSDRPATATLPASPLAAALSSAHTATSGACGERRRECRPGGGHAVGSSLAGAAREVGARPRPHRPATAAATGRSQACAAGSRNPRPVRGTRLAAVEQAWPAAELGSGSLSRVCLCAGGISS
jgi:hypothetical protein